MSRTPDDRLSDGGPFPADPVRAARLAALLEHHASGYAAALAEAMAGGRRDSRHPAAVVPAAVVTDLVAAFALEGPEEAAILAVETARAMARPAVSGYRASAVGLLAEGALVLGSNLELAGASAWQTVHAEGFVTLVARARRTRVTALALSQARPCAHCRQVLAEMGGAETLVLMDAGGRRLRLDDIYPWPFGPADLGAAGADGDTEAFPYLGLDGAQDDIPPDVAAHLVAAGRRGHAPYSGSAAACVLALADGALVDGTVLESVAFNPTIGPVQDALVGLLAAGGSPGDVVAAWVAVGRSAAVGHAAMALDALAAAAPAATVHVRYWA